MVNPD